MAFACIWQIIFCSLGKSNNISLPIFGKNSLIAYSKKCLWLYLFINISRIPWSKYRFFDISLRNNILFSNSGKCDLQRPWTCWSSINNDKVLMKEFFFEIINFVSIILTQKLATISGENKGDVTTFWGRGQ